jgi:hypothetical protein
MRRLLQHTGRIRAVLGDLWNTSPQYRWTFVASTVLVVATAALPAWRLLPDIMDAGFIPLHYNIYFGIDQFGPWYGVFLPAGLGTIIVFVNVTAAAMFFRTEHLLALFLAWATVTANAVLLVSTIFTITLNL